MIERRNWFACILIIVFSACTVGEADAQLPLVDSIAIESSDYLSDFQQVHTIVLTHYSHLKGKRIDADSLRNITEAQILNVKNKEDYFRCLLRYFSALQNSHTTVYLHDLGIDCSTALIEKRLFLSKVNDSRFISSGVKIKDEILKINDQPAYEWLISQLEYVTASTSEHDLNNTVWLVFTSVFKELRSYEIQTSERTVRIEVSLDVPVDYRKLFATNKANVQGKALNNTTGYIAIESMTGNVVKEFKEALTRLSSYPNLIIDVRRNTGGNSGLSEQLVAYLLDDPIRACVSHKKIVPAKSAYKGNLYILAGVQTASAAESFVLDLVESGRSVTLVGSPTAGDTGNNPKDFRTSNGIVFRIPTRVPPQVSYKGFPMEGRGIPPQISVVQSVPDYLKDIDTVLEFVLAKINKQEFEPTGIVK